MQAGLTDKAFDGLSSMLPPLARHAKYGYRSNMMIFDGVRLVPRDDIVRKNAKGLSALLTDWFLQRPLPPYLSPSSDTSTAPIPLVPSTPRETIPELPLPIWYDARPDALRTDHPEIPFPMPITTQSLHNCSNAARKAYVTIDDNYWFDPDFEYTRRRNISVPQTVIDYYLELGYYFRIPPVNEVRVRTKATRFSGVLEAIGLGTLKFGYPPASYIPDQYVVIQSSV